VRERHLLQPHSETRNVINQPREIAR
jgi:hypothetical protein